MKALKLKGWVDGILGHRSKHEIATAHWFAVKPVRDMVRATLVIGEKAYTESEVKALVLELTEASRGQWSPPSEGREIAARHGIVLDPA